jgi:hypothetical protein
MVSKSHVVRSLLVPLDWNTFGHRREPISRVLLRRSDICLASAFETDGELRLVHRRLPRRIALVRRMRVEHRAVEKERGGTLRRGLGVAKKLVAEVDRVPVFWKRGPLGTSSSVVDVNPTVGPVQRRKNGL